jgi:hypothetical protein
MARPQTFAETGSPAVTVPAGRQLLVETLSLQVNVSPTGSKLEAFVKYTSDGKSITLFVPVTYAYTEPSTGFDFYVALQDVRFVADTGTSIAVSVHTPNASGGTLFITVSGRLI